MTNGLQAGLPRWAWLAMLAVALGGLCLLPGGPELACFILALAALFGVPGWLVLKGLFPEEALSVPARIGWGFVLGVSMVLVAMGAASQLGLSVPQPFWWAYAGVSLAILVGGWVGRRESFLKELSARWLPDGPQVLLGLGVLLACAAKLVAVAALPTSPLHDPASHALMTKLVVENGFVPWFQLPFRADPWFYPPGLAILTAVTQALSGLSYAKLVLLWTNASSVFAAVAAYALVTSATRSRGAGVFAFGFLAFLSLMPSAEFFMAGKNSSVVSNFVFLAVLLATVRLRERPSFGTATLLALVTAACFILHYEKVYFLIVYGVAFGLGIALRPKSVAWRPFLGAALAAAGMAGVFVLPWLWRIRWAMAVARDRGISLVPTGASAYMGTAPSLEAVRVAAVNYWEAISAYCGVPLAWLSVLGLLALAVPKARHALPLLLFALGMALLHPAVIEPFGVSMASLTYDRITIHFAYLPTCLAAALAVWAAWHFGARLAGAWAPGIRRGLMGLAGVLLLWGGVSQYGVYHRVAATPALDKDDMAAFSWINTRLPERRPFLFPVGSADNANRRYFVANAGLYVPVYTRQDVMCHFFRIETAQIADEYRRYERLLAHPSSPEARRYWYYTRDDEPTYEPLNRWLSKVPDHRVRERYRQGHVRIVEVVAPVAAASRGRR